MVEDYHGIGGFSKFRRTQKIRPESVKELRQKSDSADTALNLGAS